MNIVVTGANSFIGQPLVNLLLEKGHMVYAIIRKNTNNIPNFIESNKLKIIHLNMENYNEINTYIPNADSIIHLAWVGARGEARKNKELQNENYENTMMLAKTAINMKVSSFIGVGSQAEYETTREVTSESSKTLPETEYGKAKLKSYTDIESIYHLHNVRFSWIRIFSLYGIGDYKSSLVEHTVNQLLNNKNVKLTPATHMWNYLYISDAVMGICKILETTASGVLNLAHPTSMPLKDYIVNIKKQIFSKGQLKFGKLQYMPNTIYDINPCVKKIMTETDWTPQISFEEGTKEIIKYKTLIGEII